jgi:hypothetical protein
MAALADRPGLLLGFGARRFNSLLLFVLPPTVVAVSFYLIADFDSPRGGAVQILPLNLTRLAKSLNAP